MIVLEYIIVGIAFVLAGYLVFAVLEILYGRLFSKPLFVNTAIILKKLPFKEIKFLENNFSFYQKLSPKKKRAFQHRVVRFIQKKKFVRMASVVITSEIKLLISATAVMLTFGMRNYKIRAVKTFLIYPTTYYSQLREQDHIGEFNATLKIIVFSWEHFLKGYELENDNLNLGIHEFSHALHYNSMQFWDTNSILFVNGFSKIQKLFHNKEGVSILQNSSYLRDYAFTNMYEFFAVCVEHYIESPHEFKKEHPILYKILHRMLNYEFLK